MQKFVTGADRQQTIFTTSEDECDQNKHRL
jgi:hypothetical protein